MAEEEKQKNSGDGAIQINGDNVTVVQIGPLLTSLAESQLQANFFVATGMRCSKEVRLQMEHLMEEHGFTSRELARAWNAHVIAEQRKTKKLIFTSRKFDLTIGWFGIGLTTLTFISLMVQLIARYGSGNRLYASIAAAGLLASYAAILALFFWSFIWPQHTAKRVQVALGSCELCETK